MRTHVRFAVQSQAAETGTFGPESPDPVRSAAVLVEVERTTVVRVVTFAAARMSCSRCSSASGEATRTLRM
jgi:adenine C2-methylase RlmN of 23S rRNA A2503 and tRNA A37